MGYWGWRPLVLGIFISTWVVGCNIVTDNASPSAAPRTYPHVTLTAGRLPTARVSAAPTRAAPTHVFTPEPSPPDPASPFALLVQPPTCYEIRPRNLLCLGRVDNPLAFPVESVTIQVRLLQSDGSIYQSERSTVEQPSIPSGSFAPYQATFEAEPDAFSAADARLIHAARSAEDRIVVLVIKDISGEIVNGQLIIRATVHNPGAKNAELARAFVTVLDAANRVIGYRVVSFDTEILLNSGAQLPLTLELTPQEIEETPQYALYIEAHAVEE